MNETIAFLLTMAALIFMTWLVARQGRLAPLHIQFKDPRLEALIALLPTALLLGFVARYWILRSPAREVNPLAEGSNYTFGDVVNQLALSVIVLLPFVISMGLRKQEWDTIGISPSPGGDRFLEPHPRARPLDADCGGERARRTHHQVVFSGGERRVVRREGERLRRDDVEEILQFEGLEEGAELVVSVRAAAGDLQAEVDLREAEAEQSPDTPAEVVTPVEPPELNLLALSAQTRQLLYTFVGLSFFFGSWFIWKDTLPALEFLRGYRLDYPGAVVAGAESAAGKLVGGAARAARRRRTRTAA